MWYNINNYWRLNMNKDFIIKNSKDENKCFLYAYIGKDIIVSIPKGVTHISSFAFADADNPNNNIKEIIIPDSVYNIDQQAFAYCHKLEKIVWPNNEKLKTLDVNLFRNCLSLTELKIPKSIKYITLFIMPTNLKKLLIHDDLLMVDQAAFIYENNSSDFNNSFTIKMLLQNPNYKLIDGFIINQKHKTALCYVSRDKKKIQIPDGVEIIAPCCFEEIAYFEKGLKYNYYFNSDIIPVENIIIPESVRIIDAGAFNHCKKLKSVIYKGKTNQIDVSDRAFIDCGKMSKYDSRVICQDTVISEKKERTTNWRLDRIIIIHQEIKKGTYPSATRLRNICRQEFGSEKLSIATINRDIRFLKDRFNAPIVSDLSRKGYYYTSEFELKF